MFELGLIMLGVFNIPDYLQYGALGLLALVLVGNYLLLSRLVDRMSIAQSQIAQALNAINKTMLEMVKDNGGAKSEIISAVRASESSIVNTFRPTVAAKKAT